MKTVLLVLAIAAASLGALGAAGSAAAGPGITFECTQPASPLPGTPFTCTQGALTFACLSGTPAPGSFTCNATVGNRSFVCTRSGVNQAKCLLGKNPNPFDCTLVPGTPTNQLICTQKP